jgi:predicted GH43/DUF377 family glycosyl hydrolase
MKTSLFILLVILSFFLVTGSRPSPASPTQKRTDSFGSVMMKLDNSKMPSGVNNIITTLIRNGFDSLTTTVHHFDGGSVQISFTNVPVGPWHLKVNAFDISQVVLYRGQTDIAISENATTQVSLMLSPVQSGTGSVAVTIGWESVEARWTDYSGNPVVVKSSQDIESKGPLYPQVLYEGGIYKMWYSFYRNPDWAIGYATSPDGIVWTRSDATPIFTKNSDPNAYDGKSVARSVVIHIGSSYKMYYNASSYYGVDQIGLAISNDGINWIRSTSPVLNPASDTWEDNGIGPYSVLKTDTGYIMYYHGTIDNIAAIGLAYSSDGIQWSKYSRNPILSATNIWEGDLGIYCPSVIYDQGVFKMVYTSRNSTSELEAFGFATSTDGKTWTKDNTNPFFALNMASNHWATSDIAYPCFGKFGSCYRIYYNGLSSSGWGIGLLKNNKE